jgi:hypothetical protein
MSIPFALLIAIVVSWGCGAEDMGQKKPRVADDSWAAGLGQQERETTLALIGDSDAGKSLRESDHLSETMLTPRLAEAAKRYVEASPGKTSYHVLFALRGCSPAVYREVPAPRRAMILCAALQNVRCLDDWGNLRTDGSHDGEAAIALLETGSAALPSLRPILADRSPGPLSVLVSTEASTLSRTYQYRRADFAYRYIMLILGRKPTFLPEPEQRDRLIADLQKELANKK